MPPLKGGKRQLRRLRRGLRKDSRGRPGAGGRHEGRTHGGTPAAPFLQHRAGTRPPPLRDHIETASALGGLLHECPGSTGSTPASNPAGIPTYDAPARTRHHGLHLSSPFVILHPPLDTCPPAVPGHSTFIMTAIRLPPSPALVRIRCCLTSPSLGPIRASPPPPFTFKDPRVPVIAYPYGVLQEKNPPR